VYLCMFELYREVLKEDATGSLQASVDDVVHKSKRRRLLDRPVNVRLGMVCFFLIESCITVTVSGYYYYYYYYY